MAGFGRGIPLGAAGAAPPSRAAGGRGALLCMPCLDENGLLPGRAPGALGAGAFGPGRGPGVGAPGLGAAAAGAAGAAGAGAAGAADAAGATGATGASGAGSGVGSGALRGPGTGPGTRFGATCPAGSAAGAAGVGAAGAADAGADGVGAGAAALLPDFLAPWARSASPCTSLRRRTTGASTVEEADFTYSPMSFRVLRTTLLSTPNSLASSWTLTATFLLQGGPTPKEDQTTS